MSRASKDRRTMSTSERPVGGAEIEVVAKATRRRFPLDYKRKILREADGCKTPGAVGALLRREGLYSSHLATWRAARDRGGRGHQSHRYRSRVVNTIQPGFANYAIYAAKGRA